jgi:hypothetical protein
MKYELRIKSKNVIRIAEKLQLDLITSGAVERDQNPTILPWEGLLYVPFSTTTNTCFVFRLLIKYAIQSRIRSEYIVVAARDSPVRCTGAHLPGQMHQIYPLRLY